MTVCRVDRVRHVFTSTLDDQCRERMALCRENGAKAPWICQGRTSLTGVGDEGASMLSKNTGAREFLWVSNASSFGAVLGCETEVTCGAMKENAVTGPRGRNPGPRFS